jgi:hypothetical protein
MNVVSNSETSLSERPVDEAVGIHTHCSHQSLKMDKPLLHQLVLKVLKRSNIPQRKENEP